ncbi:PREDICTED: protein patched homolog 3-like [Nicrophorus vespilloides]|uniref:Protein patched homolog 3-like n=1 Tax=Nicrophorus vespilloides TaxID=110193 RepID=A0ABM1M1L0_NICVS|nr:PREDICTED: protein patched homolog 3-like [Nicrophorus vespilloides]XP_017768461.1 PREDICTED: protein patched homolog 3-like [Nicrophorus vespilloides]XP_017768462.1 PREDICTED: protein patched homolog 3-like [Nicrophorus vespilloides]XP_017768463.1 PREDICTED: protein patched homolog 3-like [Nicrophorus vespilloides]XP_017768464.1 PREDICTED: protein patched homolog 3-like [Nicrophorus vespilloides]XP_017768465.1 PREDICTED: protein patched homolog 3-like [Nicrophorus vespilloides]XP_01776846
MDKETNNIKWYQRFTYSVVTYTELFFYKLGIRIAKSPFITIALCWMFVILSAFGLFRFHQEKSPIKLWVPPNSQFVADSERLMETFETAYRIQMMQIVADDVLTPEVFMELHEVDELVRNSVTRSGIHWNDVCFKIPQIDQGMYTLMMPYRRGNNTEDFDPSLEMDTDTYCGMIEGIEKECFEKSVLDLWDHSDRKIKKLTKQAIVDKINKFKIDPLLGQLKNYGDLLGGVTTNSTGHIIAAKSLNNYWMALLNFSAVNMDEIGNSAGTNDWASAECLEWEETFLNIMKYSAQRAENFKIYYTAARSFGDISGATMFQDLDILFIGVFIMVFYVQFVISKFNCVEARMILGCFGLLSVGMAFVVAAGLCSLFGVFYGPVHTSLPFLLMGLGVDDMFVIMACWEQLTPEQKLLPLPEKVGAMMKHAGVSITVTTATDVLAFFIGSSTILPCLQSYCIYAALGVLMTFIFVVTFYVACFTIDQRRVEKHISGFWPWKRYENYKPNPFSQAETSNKVFNLIYSKVILTWPGKLLVLCITLICLGLSIESVFKLEQRFDPTWFIPQHTYLGEFLKQKFEYFPNNGFEAATYVGAVNYTYEFKNVIHIDSQLENSSDIVTDINSWVGPFRNYVKVNYKIDIYNETLEETKFNDFLSKFLFSMKGAQFQGNFKFEKPLQCGIPAPKIMMSSIDYKFKLFSGPEEHVPAMRRSMSISKDVNFTTGDRFSTAFSKVFASWITDEVIDAELLRNLQLALIAVMACTMLLIANLQICFWVFICILLSIVNVCGFMQRWGLTIDLVTCIGLTLAIGLCVDYATHIGHTFLTIGEGSLNDRALKTVTSIGSAVLYGGTSTLIGVAMLGVSDAYNFQTFFKIFLLVVIFGLFHGVVLLPVILSCIGPKPYFTHKLVQQTDIALT